MGRAVEWWNACVWCVGQVPVSSECHVWASVVGWTHSWKS